MLYFIILSLAKVNMASPMRDMTTFLVTPRAEHVKTALTATQGPVAVQLSGHLINVA